MGMPGSPDQQLKGPVHLLPFWVPAVLDRVIRTIFSSHMSQLPLLQTPPAFCQYVDGPCDQTFSQQKSGEGLFLFGSRPPAIAGAIETAAMQLDDSSDTTWRTWQGLGNGGQIIFCEICKAIRRSETVFTDVTTLNFNLLFELGFCIGLDVPVVPIRDPSYVEDKKAFQALGVLDTLKYIEFRNASELAKEAAKTLGSTALQRPPKKTYRDAPLYVLKGPIDTEGAVQLMATLKKSPLHFRTYDPDEKPRASLHHHWKHVQGSFGVFAHLLSPNREGAVVHNALCALVCGIAMAEQKAVLLLQEEGAEQPIDYRDLVQTYERPDQVQKILEQPIASVFERLQDLDSGYEAPPPDLLSRIDLGDGAAENEVAGLKSYYVRTGQFTKAVQGHARLVVGRKGAGKTALFYAVRRAAQKGQQTLVLDLKPEGHQFTRLREAVLAELSPGQREQAVEAFWTFLLIAEVAHKILNSPRELLVAEREPTRFERYETLQKAYEDHGLGSSGDFSQRLLRQVDRIAQRLGGADELSVRTDLPELIYGRDIRSLANAVAAYVGNEKDAVWLLIDNLDKSWATRGTTPEDIEILNGLLDASRSLQRQFEARDVTFPCLVFIRTDILEHLNRHTADRGKESTISLDWNDAELFREIVRSRLKVSAELDGDFTSVWNQVAEPTIGTQDSFQYLVDRTLMRPRDLLLYLEQAIEVATNRGHSRIKSDDILHAESSYSEAALLWLGYEIEDTNPDIANAIYEFYGCDALLELDGVQTLLRATGISDSSLEKGIELLFWFGFLGIRNMSGEEEFSYQVQFNLRKLLHPAKQGKAKVVVHKAFRSALSIEFP